jgi:hypothetical protein
MPKAKRPNLHVVKPTPDWWPEREVINEDDLRKATLALHGSIESIAEAFDFTPRQVTPPLLVAVKMFLNDLDEEDHAGFLDSAGRQ